jgi:ATP cone domain/Restriction endonuclease
VKEKDELLGTGRNSDLSFAGARVNAGEITRVTKRSGEMEEFDRSKTMAAIMRAGTTKEDARDILIKLEPMLYDGITTEEIYARVRSMLNARTAARFGLKKAILALGPEGHNFETLVHRLFQAMGYQAKVREIVQGKCLTHEVDVMMEKDELRYMAECKFHNSLALKCSIQTALYTYGRFLDVDAACDLQCPYLVTNTRFSSDVVRYADCICMRLIGWNYPEQGGLEHLIEKYRLYPVTMLDLRKYDIRTLLDNDIVLLSDVLDKRDVVIGLLGREGYAKVARMAESLR